MKGLIVLLTVVVAFVSSTIEKPERNDVFADAATGYSELNELHTHEIDRNPLMGAWQDAYAIFLRELPTPTNNTVSLFSLRDLDSNGIPELLIVQMDDNAMNAILTVCTYTDNIYKIGEYTNPKESFVGGFCFSNNPVFPGLFELWWGGGVDHYGYLFVKDGELIYEYLWYDDHTSEPPYQKEISSNKQLISESVNAYPPYDYYISQSKRIEIF